MHEMRVFIKIWKTNNKVEWTSLMGPDKKRMLEKLPTKLENFLEINEIDATCRLWKVTL